MRYAVLHCRNPRCNLKVWVPSPKLGSRGRCPQCGQTMTTPRTVPPDELLDGPPLMEENDESRELAAGAV